MESSSNSIIPYLFLITFLIALALGVWQYRRARKAKDEHHRSASAKVEGEPYSAGNAQRPTEARPAGAPTSSTDVLRN